MATALLAASNDQRLDPIHCCIVQDHHQVVRFLQSCWRGKVIPRDGLDMLHYDSHPDMAIMRPERGELKVDATPSSDDTLTSPKHQQLQLKQAAWRDWFDMRSLADRLDCQQGIAEWVLPLTGAGGRHIDCVLWVKPTRACGQSWCTQFDCGMYAFHLVAPVGECLAPLEWPGSSAVTDDSEEGVSAVRVDLNAAYYLDEGDVLFPARGEVETLLGGGAEGRVLMAVGTSAAAALSHAAGAHGSGRPWVLDVCLDYFSCSNPFRQALRRVILPALRLARLAGLRDGAARAQWERALALLAPAGLAPEDADGVPVAALTALALDLFADAFGLLRFRQLAHSSSPLVAPSGGRDKHSDDSINCHNRRISLAGVGELFTEAGAGCDGSEELPPLQSFRWLYVDGSATDRLLVGLAALLPLLPPAVPALALSYGTLLLLPHHLSATEDILRLVRGLARDLCEVFSAAGAGAGALASAPCVVTIARSTTEAGEHAQQQVSPVGDDSTEGGCAESDFTPVRQVEFIQRCVRAVLDSAGEHLWRPAAGGPVDAATRVGLCERAVEQRLGELSTEAATGTAAPAGATTGIAAPAGATTSALRYHCLYELPEEGYDAHVYSLFLHTRLRREVA
jgi:hypothetical protein